MTFKENLKTIRKFNHLSQEKLAEKIGVSRQSVSKWETGESYPSTANLVAICTVTHCKITDLIDQDASDIENFPKKTQQEISSLKAEDRARLAHVSKILYILAKIARFASLLGFIIIGVVLYLSHYAIVAYLFSDAPEGATWADINLLTFAQYGALIKTLPIIFIVVCAIFSIICLYRIFRELEFFFKRLSSGEAMFSLDNVLSLKRTAKNLLLWTLADNLPKPLILCTNTPFTRPFNFASVIFALIAICLAYVFQYGNLLEDKKAPHGEGL